MEQPITGQPLKRKYTREDFVHAAATAQTMVREGKILQVALTTMIASRQLYMVAREVLDGELKHGWECDDPELVLQTLVLSAQTKANESFTVMALQQTLLGAVVPLLDILVNKQQEEQAVQPAQEGSSDAAECNDGAVLLPGGDDGSAA